MNKKVQSKKKKSSEQSSCNLLIAPTQNTLNAQIPLHMAIDTIANVAKANIETIAWNIDIALTTIRAIQNHLLDISMNVSRDT